MLRAFALLMLAVLALATCQQTQAPPRDESRILRFTQLALPPGDELAKHLGPFELARAWQITSPHTDFGSYSALVPLGDGRMMALSDAGGVLRFTVPGGRLVTPVAFANVFAGPSVRKQFRDVESAARDPISGRLWLGFEGSNSITRHDIALTLTGKAAPRAMRGWGANSGAEAMVRLADGRFIVISEGFGSRFATHANKAVLFARDPVASPSGLRFTFDGPEHFKPTDMAQLPDGRVLVLMRKVVWPLPLRVACRLAIADPSTIRRGGVWRAQSVAMLSSSLPVDNFEGMAVLPRSDGRLDLWLISDDNRAATQRTLLWQLIIDPAKLPGAPALQPRTAKPEVRPQPSLTARASP